MRILTLAIICGGLLSGCGGTPQIGGASGLSVLTNTSLPVPDRKDRIVDDRAYYIGPYDKLLINVFGIEELSKIDVQVDASGRISFPLIGTVTAGGQTPEEVGREIEGRLQRQFIREPRVAVNLLDTVSHLVTVEGEVKEPGLYPVIGRMTLLRAIASAKGTTDFSDLKHIVVFRTVDSQRYAALYNLKAIRLGQYPDPDIYPNDVVVVSDSEARRIFRDILQITPLLTTPIIVALQN